MRCSIGEGNILLIEDAILNGLCHKLYSKLNELKTIIIFKEVKTSQLFATKE